MRRGRSPTSRSTSWRPIRARRRWPSFRRSCARATPGSRCSWSAPDTSSAATTTGRCCARPRTRERWWPSTPRTTRSSRREPRSCTPRDARASCISRRAVPSRPRRPRCARRSRSRRAPARRCISFTSPRDGRSRRCARGSVTRACSGRRGRSTCISRASGSRVPTARSGSGSRRFATARTWRRCGPPSPRGLWTRSGPITSRTRARRSSRRAFPSTASRRVSRTSRRCFRCSTRRASAEAASRSRAWSRCWPRGRRASEGCTRGRVRSPWAPTATWSCSTRTPVGPSVRPRCTRRATTTRTRAGR